MRASSPAMQIVLSGNSPGELWGWVRPVVFAARKEFPLASIALFLFPCQYATGNEARVARELLGISMVIQPRDSLRYIFTGKKPDGFSPKAPVLLHLGGDLFFAAMLGKRLGARAYAYQWGERWWDKSISAYFVPNEKQRDLLISRKIPPHKIVVAGDLVVDAIQQELSANGSARTGKRSAGYRVGLFPGSRVPELRHLLPFYLRVIEMAVERLKEITFHLVISPFVDDSTIAAMIRPGLRHILESGSGEFLERGGRKFIQTTRGAEIEVSRGNQYEVMKESDCLLTIPGTKCAEAGYLAVPMLVTLPTNRMEKIPYPGIPHLLEMVPFVGGLLKRGLLTALLPRFGFTAHPNILAREEVVPEMVDKLTPEKVADALLSLVQDEPRKEKMRDKLRQIYREQQPAAEKMLAFILEDGVAE